MWTRKWLAVDNMLLYQLSLLSSTNDNGNYEIPDTLWHAIPLAEDTKPSLQAQTPSSQNAFSAMQFSVVSQISPTPTKAAVIKHYMLSALYNVNRKILYPSAEVSEFYPNGWEFLSQNLHIYCTWRHTAEFYLIIAKLHKIMHIMCKSRHCDHCRPHYMKNITIRRNSWEC